MNTEDNSNPDLVPMVVEPPKVLATVPEPVRPTPTAQQLRVVEVSEALVPAYQRASTLELTDAELDSLMAPFPDTAVEIRPHDGLIYIPHIHLSDRLNRVFRPGKWALIRRREWIDGATMYAEYVLLVRGCFVGESIGGADYHANNPRQNYSDVLEATAAEALRRICGKRLSCGSQVWDPTYAQNWVSKYAEGRGGKWRKRGAPTPEAHKPTGEPEPSSFDTAAPAPPPTAPKPTPATPADSRIELVGMLKALSEKSTKTGKMRYGFLVIEKDTNIEHWLGSFDSKDAETGKVLKGHDVACMYVTEGNFKNLVHGSLAPLDITP